MLYVKGNLETVAIDYDNVFAKCPDCGHLHNIDLVEILDIAEDVHTSVFCERCLKQREQEGEKKIVSCDYCDRCTHKHGISVCQESSVAVMVGGKNTNSYFWCNGEEFEEIKEMED